MEFIAPAEMASLIISSEEASVQRACAATNPVALEGGRVIGPSDRNRGVDGQLK
jgi:hypothetical protein